MEAYYYQKMNKPQQAAYHAMQRKRQIIPRLANNRL